MTAQSGDILIFNNEKHIIASEPLADYLKKIKLPYELTYRSTNLMRAYRAKWAIDNRKLFLIEWYGYIPDYDSDASTKQVGMDYIFPGEEIIFADWFTGEIRIAMGNLVSYVHGGYASVYEGDRFLEFENGVLTDEYTEWLTKKEIKKIKREEDWPPR